MAPNSTVTPLSDTQSSTDIRGVAINRVGVTSVSYPIDFSSSPASDSSPQTTVASFDIFVALPADRRGTHMSRFVQALREWETAFDLTSLQDFTESLLERLRTETAELKVRFPFFIDRMAPVTGEKGKIRLEVMVEVERGTRNDLKLTVAGPATSLCPCSKEISDRGAHNQRCELTVSIRLQPGTVLTIEELYEKMEQSASTQIYPVLKRPDEKRVTEDAYDNPKFVEDIVRDLALALSDDDRIAWYQCASENFESIHQHNAYAQVESST